MKPPVLIGVGLFCAVVSFSLGFTHPFGEPVPGSPKEREALLRGANMPAAARDVLIAKCADCHSDATHSPLYAHFAPASWLIDRDVVEGRKRMNLSQWTQLSAEQQQELSAKIVHEAKGGEMPLLQYRAIHWGSGLSASDVKALEQLTGGAMIANATGDTTAGDATRGKAVFEKRCVSCHQMETGGEGPRLRGVFGSKAGSAPGFSYSKALLAAGITWDENSLNRWLTDPDEMLPGNGMDFRVPKPQERLDLIAYLKASR